jgi:hypothetical protein
MSAATATQKSLTPTLPEVRSPRTGQSLSGSDLRAGKLLTGKHVEVGLRARPVWDRCPADAGRGRHRRLVVHRRVIPTGVQESLGGDSSPGGQYNLAQAASVRQKPRCQQRPSHRSGKRPSHARSRLARAA